jgi:hypothetical protein
MTEYLQLTDSSGTVTEGSDSWFAISDLSFTTSLSSSTGAESFSAMSFTIDPSALTGSLLQLQGLGTSVSAEIAGYARVSDGQEGLFQLDMVKTARISALTLNADGSETVTLSYSDLREQTYNGTSTTPVAGAGWNTVAKAADTTSVAAPASFAQVQGALAPNSAVPLEYYVQFRNSSGVALAGPDGKTWFAVTSPSADSTAPAGGGILSFGGMSFTLVPGQALPLLFQDQTTDAQFGQVELAGYEVSSGNSPALIEDTVFGTASIISLATGGDGSVTVTMAYDSEVDTTFAGTTRTTQGWNATTGSFDTTATVAAGVAAVPSISAAQPPLIDYLQVTGGFGTVTEGSDSWFAISDLSFTTSVSSSTGAESFSAMSFTIFPSALTGGLLELQGPGVSLSAEIAGYGRVSGGQEGLFQLDMVNNAHISTLTLNADGTETVTLSYSDLREQTYNGTSTTPVAGAGWNTVTKAADTTTVAAPASFAQVQGALAPDGLVPLVYFVQFRNSSGTALASPDGKTWFAVTSPGAESTTSAGGGALSFGGTSFTLAPGQALPLLFQDQTAAAQFGQVELAGYEVSSGNSPALVQDTVFGTASISSLATGGDGSVTVTMTYDSQVDTTDTGTTNTMRGWNATTRTTDTTATVAAPKSTFPAADTGFPVDPACFCAGTRIRTPRGEVPVEALNIGDLVLTVEGLSLPIRWIGRRTLHAGGRHGYRFADPLIYNPIRIRAGALGETMPVRDLLVSADHGILVEDVLVQAGALVNGFSVVRQAGLPEQFTFFHIELADHALILAEGTPAETFVDNVSRMGFDNWDEHEALYPLVEPIAEMPYPRALSHRQVPTGIHAGLMARATAVYGPLRMAG